MTDTQPKMGHQASSSVLTVTGTGSKLTKVLGIGALVAAGLQLFFGLYYSGPEVVQGESVRLFYVHVPSILTAYLGFGTTLVGSIVYLRKGSQFWDLVAGAAAEIAVIFCAFALFTGAMWGKPTWGVYWQWDPRLTSTTVLFVMYVGYLAVRRLDLDPTVRSRRAAVLGIVSFLNVIIVHYSVDWWRGLHQQATFGVDTKLDGLMLFSFFLGWVAFTIVFAWLVIHRFRVSWLEHQVRMLRLDEALVERRAEAVTQATKATGALS